jgi:hypothetical protein
MYKQKVLIDYILILVLDNSIIECIYLMYSVILLPSIYVSASKPLVQSMDLLILLYNDFNFFSSNATCKKNYMITRQFMNTLCICLYYIKKNRLLKPDIKTIFA